MELQSLQSSRASSSLATSSSSSSSSTIQWKYDVFLNFRGKDTRKTFTDHLYTNLVQVGIHTFRDDEEIDKGEELNRSLPKAIEESKIFIIVFSTNYASSTWCLRELAKILECRREAIGQMVLPIFLKGADPSDIRKQTERKQTGSFADALSELEERCKHEGRFVKEDVDRWRAALYEAAGLSGWNQEQVANGHESELIKIVVERVLSELDTIPLDAAKHPVGIDSRVEDMKKLLNNSTAVGICGMGGIGKTTIAKAVYNQIFRSFEGSSFLEDVREASKQYNGLLDLQKQLLSDILKQDHLLSNVNRGKGLIKGRLRAKKILVVLDNVDRKDQFEALAGGPDWFGSGSRVIITSRDEHVLNLYQVNEIYEPKELDFHQSLQLFSNHAFGRSQPLNEYVELAKNVVQIAGGLPLALEMLGSFLFDKRKQDEWESELEKLKKIPNEDVQEKLKVSYDALHDLQKELFLDIACFFSGTPIEYANYILESCHSYYIINIKVLIQKSFVKIGKDDMLRMHDQIRDMGREIIRKEAPDELGKQSRLWSHEEALQVLKEGTGTRNVKGLRLNFDQDESEDRNFSTDAFIALTNLKLLQIDGAQLVGDFNHLSSKLRWLSWRRCPLDNIPTNFLPEKLAVLDFSDSKFSQVWDMWHQNKLYENLKVLNLSRCCFITRTPDFSRIPHLKTLNLEWCEELVQVHESIGILNSLVLLDLSYCGKVLELPRSICTLSSLQKRLLNKCLKLTKLPEDLGSMVSLTTLTASRTALDKLPDSIGYLKNLIKLRLRHVESMVKLPDSLSRLESLTSFHVSGLRITELPNFLGSLNKLEYLQLGGCKEGNRTCLCLDGFITELPDAIGFLENLKRLDVSNCRNLVKLPYSMGKMKSLTYFYMNGTSIIKLPEDFGELSSLEELYMTGCRELKSLPENFVNLGRLRILFMGNSGIVKFPKKFSDLPELIELEVDGCQELESLPENFINLIKLNALSVNNCNLLDGVIPSDIGKLPSLEFLLLGGNKFDSLPASISDLSKLDSLSLENCTSLQALPKFPPSLNELNITNCISLEGLPDVSNLKNLESLFLANCTRLQGLPKYVCNIAQPDTTKCMSNTLSPMQVLEQQGLFEHLCRLSFHGSNIPDWFIPVEFKRHDEGCFYSEQLRIPSVEVAQPRLSSPDIEITGLIICFIFVFLDNVWDERYKRLGDAHTYGSVQYVVERNDKTIFISDVSREKIPIAPQDQYQIYLRFLKEESDRLVNVLKDGDQFQVLIEPDLEELEVEKAGIYVVYKSNEDDPTVQHSVYKRLVDFLTSSRGGCLGDGMSSGIELWDSSAEDESETNGSDEEEVDQSLTLVTPDSLHLCSSSNVDLLLPPNPKKRKNIDDGPSTQIEEESSFLAIIESLNASFTNMTLAENEDGDVAPPKPRRKKGKSNPLMRDLNEADLDLHRGLG